MAVDAGRTGRPSNWGPLKNGCKKEQRNNTTLTLAVTQKTLITDLNGMLRAEGSDAEIGADPSAESESARPGVSGSPIDESEFVRLSRGMMDLVWENQ